MCPSIEEYAMEIAMDRSMSICFDFDKSKEETIEIMKDVFPEIEEAKIISRVNAFWNKKVGVINDNSK